MPSSRSADSSVAEQLVDAARTLSARLDGLHFAPPVHTVYDPLQYAWAPHEAYLRRFATGPREVVFLGMNPGPFGMMQVGVPFGEVAAVRDWMGIEAEVTRPAHEHPKRPIEGFACRRSEVSGRRVWGWAAEHWGTAERFFSQCFVLNYCPLAFLEAGGRNLTPDKLPAAERAPMFAACDDHLVSALLALRPRWAIGIGGFARARLDGVAARVTPVLPGLSFGTILHPSPASPAANRGWGPQVDASLTALGVPLPEDAGARR